MHPALSVVIVLLSLSPRSASPHAQYDWPENRESDAIGEGGVRRTYRLEDFLWTGSGDGEVEPSPRPHGLGSGVLAFTTTTVYKTTTATTTVLATPTPLYTTSLIITTVPRTVCLLLHRSPVGPITPTASFPLPGDGSVPSTVAPFPSPSWTLLNGGGSQEPEEAYDDSLPDPRFWLVTVLKANDTQDWHLSTDILESRLARLYKAAFLRQQERHLGIVNASALAALARLRRAPDVVRVTVHNVTTLGHGLARWHSAGPGPGLGTARLLYWVRVRGRPVPAATAAHDMRLISDHEMAAELGLPIITKAEPFLNAPVPLAARGRTRDAWLLVGAAGCGVALLLLMLALAAAALSQRSRAARRRRRVTGSAASASAQATAGLESHGGQSGHGAANRRRHFQGRDNKGFLPDDQPHKRDKSSPGFLGVAGADRAGASSGSASGSRSSFSCASSCSGSSSDAALVRRRGIQPTGHHHGHHHHHHQTVHHAVNPTLVDTLHLTEDDVVVPHPRGTSVAVGTSFDLDVLDAPGQGARRASPNSYLSMPSVKQFPRGASMPEPLTRVLEPAAVCQLDGEDSGERVTVSPATNQPRSIMRPPPPRQALTAPVRAPPSIAVPRPAASMAPCRPDDVPRAARTPAELPAAACAATGPSVAAGRGVRHSSLEGDPGVLGPVVWGLRCQRLTSAGGGSDGSGTGTLSDGVGSPPPVGRMRRRFHELLDDAFSLFAGSRSASRSASQDEDSSSASPPPPGPPVAGLQLSSVLDHVLPGHPKGAPPDQRVQSAVQRPVAAPFGEMAPRPKTSTMEARRPSTASSAAGASTAGPRGAWGSDQAVARPLSAGPFHRPQLPDVQGLSGARGPSPMGCVTPRVDTAVILADARLPPHDPAVPLIAAIKHELSKFSAVTSVPSTPSAMPLPGYTPPRN